MNHPTRILIFTGDGKGKTTAALGMALRANGHGMPVAIIQFVQGDPAVGELTAAAGLQNVEIVQTGLGFLPRPEDPHFSEHRAAAEEGLRKARQTIAAGRHSLVILDEVCLAVARGLLDEQAVIAAVREARPEACIVLTGRYATPGLIELADTVTEMRSIKHGFAVGRQAQKGVEL
ncbi:MAG: cob(I)yrinic acid a,c-diamide adenosyltransferase [Thermoguttaceae bacterium]|jgi:cob(I)alamin adenosyltransferase